MLTSHQPRAVRTPQYQHNPSVSPLCSPPTTPPRGRRPSLSNTMNWLTGRSNSSQSAPYSPSKPTRISETKLIRSIEILSPQRSGVLGAGATVVRTPDEALRDSSVRLTYEARPREQAPPRVEPPQDSKQQVAQVEEDEEDEPQVEDIASEFPSPPNSPPLPSLPFPEPTLELSRTMSNPAPATPLPQAPSPRPSLKSSSAPGSYADSEPAPVPPFPRNTVPSPPPPAFRPILVSEVPSNAIDPSKIIVTLETCTATYRTTMDTLCSRPSHLSTYITSLVRNSRCNSDASSVYSAQSDDVSTYQHHLTGLGLLPQSSFSIHIFLDRPSTPYPHILNYLRSPPSTPDCPESLPYAARLHTPSPSRLEVLLELRDEANYLGLDGLYNLCTDELRQRAASPLRLHGRGQSSSSSHSAGAVSIHSMQASVCSLHTLLEHVDDDVHTPKFEDVPTQRDSKQSEAVAVARSPPTPQSWNGREKSHSRHSSVRSPPKGWI